MYPSATSRSASRAVRLSTSSRPDGSTPASMRPSGSSGSWTRSSAPAARSASRSKRSASSGPGRGPVRPRPHQHRDRGVRCAFTEFPDEGHQGEAARHGPGMVAGQEGDAFLPAGQIPERQGADRAGQGLFDENRRVRAGRSDARRAVDAGKAAFRQVKPDTAGPEGHVDCCAWALFPFAGILNPRPFLSSGR